MLDTITMEVQALERLDLEGLRRVWRERIGEPPRLRSKELLCLLLAWRIQSNAWGDIPPSVRRVLRQPTPAAGPSRLSVGLTITKEWQGRRHEVETTSEGFVWEDSTYPSLSAVARAITGTKWNGPRFFGLREEQP